MKRVVCLLLVVLIACAGCYDTEIDKFTDKPISDKRTEVPKQNKKPSKIAQIPYSRGWWDDWESFSELRQRIEKLEMELSEVKAMPEPEKALLVRIAELEAELESQRAEIENSKNIYRVYEVAIESQKLTIETLQKLCRLYEAEIESQGKSRTGEESPLGKEPEAGQQQRDEKDSKDNGVSLPQ